MTTKIDKLKYFFGLLFILSIPMQPIFKMYGFYFIAFMTCALMFVSILKSLKFKFTKFEFMEIVFIVMMLLSLVLGDHLLEKTKYVFSIVRYIVFSFFAIRSIYYYYPENCENKAKNTFEKIFNVFTLGTIIISIYILLFEPSVNGNYGRMGRYVYNGAYGGYIVYSYNLIISILWSLFKLLDKNTKNRKIYLFALILLLPCAILNGTKKILFAIVLFCLGYVLVFSKNHVERFIKVILICIITLSSYYVIMHNNYLYSLIGYRVDIYIKSLNNDYSGYVDTSTRERNLMRKKAIDYFIDSPVYGNGISSFMYKFGADYGIYLYSHNNYLEILCDLGLIGFIWYYAWFVRIIIYLIKKFKTSNTIEKFMLLFLVVILILDYGTVSFDKLHYILFLDLLSFYCLVKQEENHEQNC